MEAASLLANVRKGKGSLKSLALQASGSGGGKPAGTARQQDSKFKKKYLLASETLRYSSVLRDVLAECASAVSKSLKKDISNTNLRDVMLYELLLGKGSIAGGGALKRAIMTHADELKASLLRIKVQHGMQPTEPSELLLPVSARRFAFPRYVRVNMLKMSVDMAVDALGAAGVAATLDEHIPGLLVCPPDTRLHENDLVLDGSLVLQDKSSCFSAQALAEDYGAGIGCAGDVLDACAAPGNKTTHLMSLMAKSKGLVWAIEMDPRRLKILRDRCTLAGGDERIKCEGGNFLEVDPLLSKWDRLDAILLDPSCSGSGIVNAPERSGEPEARADTSDRIESLAGFQCKALLKAMSFPQVSRIVYSTCSVHEQENEGVVAAALAQQVAGENPFVLKRCLRKWGRRGRPVAGLSESQADCLVRVSPDADSTNGFFVALFERRPSSKVVDNVAGSQRLQEAPNQNELVADVPKKKRKRKKAKAAGD